MRLIEAYSYFLGNKNTYKQFFLFLFCNILLSSYLFSYVWVCWGFFLKRKSSQSWKAVVARCALHIDYSILTQKIIQKWGLHHRNMRRKQIVMPLYKSEARDLRNMLQHLEFSPVQKSSKTKNIYLISLWFSLFWLGVGMIIRVHNVSSILFAFVVRTWFFRTILLTK